MPGATSILQSSGWSSMTRTRTSSRKRRTGRSGRSCGSRPLGRSA